MMHRKIANFLCAAALPWLVGSLLMSCVPDGDNIKAVGGKYYLSNCDNGRGLHFYEDVSRPYSKPLVDEVYATAIVKNCLVVRASVNVFFIFSIASASRERALDEALGPYTEPEMRRKLFELTRSASVEMRPVE